jgi:hypothetical protein
MVWFVTFNWLCFESDRSRIGRLVVVESSATSTRKFDSDRWHRYDIERYGNFAANDRIDYRDNCAYCWGG